MEPVWLTAADGARLACWDFAPGTGGTPVLMLHGTGLNGPCWAPVARARALAGAGLRPLALDMRGHGASDRSPDGEYSWPLFARDVLAVIDQLGLDAGPRPGGGASVGGVLGVGHSAGASALLLAEEARPGSFSRLWTWEPIMSTPGHDLGQERGAEMADRARRRRAHFASVDEARSHLSGRGMFADFSAGSFDAFMRAALVADDGGGVRLACLPEDEARMYEAGGRHGAWEKLAQVRCPVRLVGGELSLAVPPEQLDQMAGRLPLSEVAVMAGLAHFGPFQGPAAVADDIAAWAAR